MKVEEMLHKLHEVVKTPDDEIMALPFGNSSPYEVIDWIVNLSDADFNILMKAPIIIQAKAFYKNLRVEIKGE